MKIGAPEPAPIPAAPVAAPQAAPTDELGGEAPVDDKPFDNEPFDAGVEADEASDPKTFIEQLTGKLGQSLRKYTEQQGQPDFELEKFAINSLLSATHTSEMDEEDRNDIIKKVNTAGNDDSENSDMGNQDDTNNGENNDNGNVNSNGDDNNFNNSQDNDLDELQIYESEIDESNMTISPKKMSIFAPEGSNEFMEQNRIPEGLTNTKKNSIFDKNELKSKLYETFNTDNMSEPTIEPIVKPTVQPSTAPSRRNKPFTIEPDTIPQPDPKASK